MYLLNFNAEPLDKNEHLLGCITGRGISCWHFTVGFFNAALCCLSLTIWRRTGCCEVESSTFTRIRCVAHCRTARATGAALAGLVIRVAGTWVRLKFTSRIDGLSKQVKGSKMAAGNVVRQC